VLNARGKCATIHRAYSTGIAWNMVHGAQAPCCCCALPTADFPQEVKRGGIADVSSKMLREKLVEVGRASFPSALRHNDNLLYQAIRTSPMAVVVNPLNPPPANPIPAQKEPKTKLLKIKPYGTGGKPELPIKGK
tara:strand:+ start:4254 stop:4658 length:405 start_codon:yes stop_codon:yes gene_type:complete